MSEFIQKREGTTYDEDEDEDGYKEIELYNHIQFHIQMKYINRFYR